jgi:Tol biopolymer transport system component
VQPFPSPSDQALVASVNTSNDSYFDPFLTKDGLRLYLAPILTGAPQQITVTTRTGIDQNFPASVPVPVINSVNGSESDPAVSPDDRIIVFSSHRPAGVGLGASNLWYATRQNPTADFGTPELIPTVNSDEDDGDPMLTADGCELYFSSTRNGGKYHVFHAQIAK